MELIGSALSALSGNIIVFCTVPFVWWLIRHRKECGFFRYIGLIKPELKVKLWVFAVFVALYCCRQKFDVFSLLSEESVQNIEEIGSNTSASDYAGIGLAAVLPAIIENFLTNGACEEVLFRGIICKGLTRRIGSTGRLILQAMLFSLMHNGLYLPGGIPLRVPGHVAMFVFTAIGGALLDVFNEKVFNGSIIPSILLHGTGNFIGTMMVAFSLR